MKNYFNDFEIFDIQKKRIDFSNEYSDDIKIRQIPFSNFLLISYQILFSKFCL